MRRIAGLTWLTMCAAVPIVAIMLSVGCGEKQGLPAPTEPAGPCGVGAPGDEAGDLDAALTELMETKAGGGGLAYFLLPRSGDLAAIPQDPRNPLTYEKVRLGQLLYHETALGIDNVREEGCETYSCASCHFVQAGFKANLPQGIGEGGSGFGIAGEGRVFLPQYDCTPSAPDCQPISSPTILNAAYQELMLWNGQFGGVGDNLGTEDRWTPGTPLESNFLGFQGVETQAHGGQMAHRMLDIGRSRVGQIPRYPAMFELAFPGEADPINRLNIALAIAAYERTVVASEAPFQKWLRGNKNAMTESEKRGALLFFGKANCVACHSGPALNSMTFNALGLNDLDGSCDGRVNLAPFGSTVPDATRKGRGGFTGRAEDMYKFKTPQLYNLADSPFYGHGASFGSIRAVVEYMNQAAPQNTQVPTGQLSSLFTPLGLTEGEVADISSFIEDALYDPSLDRYVPERIPSGFCFPVNDPQAREDLHFRPESQPGKPQPTTPR